MAPMVWRRSLRSAALPVSAAATLAFHAAFFAALSSIRATIASHLACAAVTCAAVNHIKRPLVARAPLKVIAQVFRALSPGGMKSAICLLFLLLCASARRGENSSV
jgi:hypothetical protein